jgi:circadian clock protein KaiC
MPAGRQKSRREIPKCPTGVTGLDQITQGGLPRARPTLICGSAGCGKTVLAMEFLVRGATEFNESGVFMSFEESDKELIANVGSMGFDLNALCARKKLYLDYVRVERSEIEETGEYDLEGLFIRLESAIRRVGAKRVVLDTIESLFSGFSNSSILRAELRRLFGWLKTRGVTALITAETGDGKLTRYGIEEYVADCVILLDHRVEDQNSIRRLRVVKYRGTAHGTCEYPFLIGETGFSVLPLSSLKLDHPAPTQRVSSGIPRLDAMLGGKGFFRGSSILVSGGAGTGKTSIAAQFVDSACRRGERALYIASEQSVSEILRNMRSIGLDLAPWIKRGRLSFHAARPGTFGLEKHLITVHDATAAFNPHVVVIDPISNFESVGSDSQVKSMLTRLIDTFKSRQITAMFTSLTNADAAPESTDVGVSSLIDTWLLLRNLECNGERNRGLYVLKSRGMAHSNQIREFVLTNQGVKLLDVYVGPSGVLTGTARAAQEARERAEATERKERLQQKSAELKSKRRELEQQIGRLQSEFAADQHRLQLDMQQMDSREKQFVLDRSEMSRFRHADTASAHSNGRSYSRRQ